MTVWEKWLRQSWEILLCGLEKDKGENGLEKGEIRDGFSNLLCRSKITATISNMTPPPATAPITTIELFCGWDSAVRDRTQITHTEKLSHHPKLITNSSKLCTFIHESIKGLKRNAYAGIRTHLPRGSVSNSSSALWLLGWPSDVRVWTRNTYFVPGKRSLICTEFFSRTRTVYVVTSNSPGSSYETMRRGNLKFILKW